MVRDGVDGYAEGVGAANDVEQAAGGEFFPPTTGISAAGQRGGC